MENRPVLYRIPHFDNKTGKFSHFSYWGTVDPDGELKTDHGCFASPGTSSGTTKGWHEQWTGKTDKTGKRIFEGDKGVSKYGNEKEFTICFGEFTDDSNEDIGECTCIGFYFHTKDGKCTPFGRSFYGEYDHIEITGTIHD